MGRPTVEELAEDTVVACMHTTAPHSETPIPEMGDIKSM